MKTPIQTPRWRVPEVITSYIDGQWQSASGPRLPVINPATEALICELAEADAEETARAVRAARAAHERGEWARRPAADKVAVFRRIVALTRDHLDELAWLECQQSGLPLRYLRQRQLPRILRNFDFFADSLSQNIERAGMQDDAYLRYVVREPAGVAALISPWNAPLALASTKIAAALAFGNSCVVKTAETTPLAVARFMELLTEAGVPAGVVNMVNGRGAVTGDALVRHPDVRVVSFTGGTATGRAIAAAGAAGLKRVDLELGGKSANIITRTAVLEDALDGALTSIYTNNGQQCFAGSRILVERAVADEFIARFVARARAIRVGDPLDEQTEVGPLSNAAHAQRVQAHIDSALQEGAELLCGGHRPEGLEKGYFLAPTALRVTSNSARVCQEEIFGPVVTFQVFDDFEQALALANDSNYGLVAYVWSQDLAQMQRAAQVLQAGVVLVNTPMILDLRFPFGGYKDSGVGREGIEGMRHFYTEEKTVTLALKRPAMERLGASG